MPGFDAPEMFTPFFDTFTLIPPPLTVMPAPFTLTPAFGGARRNKIR